ncbi:MAG: uroporphyrinogen-III C-methyltransferase [Betaproteobacteria bacterium]|nr:uroporphyrinogen-III C-methyltransferase [Betaproteobacteria bacterium]MDE2423275.1 uroporphyrinogen-III C-methyltransferase [Betaproteobacteria bacterium]
MTTETTQPTTTSIKLYKLFGWLSVIAFLGTLSLWLQYRHDNLQLREDLANRLNQADRLVKQNQGEYSSVQETLKESNHRISNLESQLADSQSQQIVLQSMYQELARNRDDWVLAEVEQLVDVANQQLQLTGNVQSALSALQSADMRLQKLNRPSLLFLHKAITEDIDRLRAVPFVDITGISNRIDEIAQNIDIIPLASDTRPPKKSAVSQSDKSNTLSKVGRELLNELSQSIQIKRIDTPELPLLSPEQSFFLRENLRLRLVSARLGALSHNNITYEADLNTAQEWIKRYFDLQSPAVKNDLHIIEQLRHAPVNMSVQDISATLNAVRRARSQKEGNHR